MRTQLEWLDTNKDGVISPEEFRDQRQIEFNARWSMWDADGDGEVSVDAVLKQKQALRAEKRETNTDKD